MRMYIYSIFYYTGRRKVSLWKFLYKMLEPPKSGNHHLIRWVDKKNFIFRVIDASQLASLWGLEKDNPTMTYDKMSRALRQYRYGEIQKIPQTKLTFRFGDVVIKEICNGNS